ncbi:hypothetical protein [Labedaea rhizosphaerae]|uniref:Uncharacterized protein n=1 Tax=Labedaea rhizosphaerae TaxID=598644 RepID=A0A4R6S002_LABRH|nr:hypothetical protein [Labedaea rhizosphaerae]TDP92801.1 hypothetical protein EV186_10716 [Labedaea rhizosphaerae]
MPEDSITKEPVFEALLRDHPDILSEENWSTMPAPTFDVGVPGEESSTQA